MQTGPPDSTRNLTRNLLARLRRGLVLATLLGLLLYAGLLFWADGDAVRESLARLAPRAVYEALLLVILGYLLRFARWELYRQPLAPELARGTSALVFFAGFAFTVSPGKLGEAYKSLLLKERCGTPLSRSAPIILAERLTDILALLVLLVLANLEAKDHPWIGPVAGLCCLLLVALLSSRRLARLFLALLSRMGPLARLGPKARAALEETRSLLRPKTLCLATLCATAAWGLECLAAWRIAGALGLPSPELSGITAAFSLSLIAGAVAIIAPGGLGVTEGLLTEQMRRRFLAGGAAPEVARAGAASATLLVRLLTLWFAVLVGLCALLLLRRRGAQETP